MDEPAKRVRTHEPNCPQNKQNHKNRPKHRYHLPAIVSTVTTDHLDAVVLSAVVCRYAIRNMKKLGHNMQIRRITRGVFCATKADEAL
jgi:hypothetical protein